MREIRSRASEEEIGRAMRHLCVRPNYVHLNSLALGYLVGREQARLTGRGGTDDYERLATVMERISSRLLTCPGERIRYWAPFRSI